jgi:hypothetical protein
MNLEQASKEMIGTTYNGNYFARKGTSRSEGNHSFSVGNLVAFGYSYYSSPDGRSYRYGCCPSTKAYCIQEEILLEEYDNTTSNKFGSGKYDCQEIIILSEEFWHTYSTPICKKTFLLQILENDKNVFLNNFITGDIAEVRNHSGKFLHIYEIPEWYRECKKNNFEETVVSINLQKKQEDENSKKAVLQNYRGVELNFGITTRGGWYKSSIGFGTWKTSRQHEYDDSKTILKKMKIMSSMPNGIHYFYIDEYPVCICLIAGREPSIEMCVSSSIGSSQSWWYDHLEKTTLKKGWIFVDGVDVVEKTVQRVDENKAATLAVRKNKFEEFSKAVTEKYGEEVLKITLRKKGSVLAILKVLSESSVQVEFAELKKILELSSSAPIIANLMVCVVKKLNPLKAMKVAEKAGAWKYLNDSLPKLSFMGHFDEAAKSLQIYGENWGYQNTPATFSLGDLLKNKLA